MQLLLKTNAILLKTKSWWCNLRSASEWRAKNNEATFSRGSTARPPLIVNHLSLDSYGCFKKSVQCLIVSICVPFQISRMKGYLPRHHQNGWSFLSIIILV